MKKINTVLLSLLALAVFFAAVLISPAKGIDGVKSKQILTLWQIDMFEGGVGSRATYLKNVAASFEKKKNVLIMIETKTVQDVEELLADNICPDMISFSSGLNGVLERAKSIDGDGFCGDVDGKTYAKCWCFGGYAEIKRKGTNPSKIILSKNPDKNIELACFLNGIDISNATRYDTKKAYDAFLSDSDSMLIGSQRDVYRLRNKIDGYDIKPLGGFTDLMQYISVVTSNGDKYEPCEDFINYLCNEEGQKNINSLGLLASDKKSNTADNGLIDRFFNQNYIYSTSAFLTSSEIGEIEKTVLNGSITDDEKNKILKTFVKRLKL